jgi:hypothetical protein
MEKHKRKATICQSDGLRLDVNFFLGRFAEEHSGKELIIDILNSKATFIPLEDIRKTDVLFLNKRKIVCLELYERDLSEETMLVPGIQVQVELTTGEVFNGDLFLEMPQDRSRVSDYLNFSPGFIYLGREEGDIILNKDFIFSVKDKSDKITDSV